jgi:hypothetical protein
MIFKWHTTLTFLHKWGGQCQRVKSLFSRSQYVTRPRCLSVHAGSPSISDGRTNNIMSHIWDDLHWSLLVPTQTRHKGGIVTFNLQCRKVTPSWQEMKLQFWFQCIHSLNRPNSSSCMSVSEDRKTRDTRPTIQESDILMNSKFRPLHLSVLLLST